MVHILNRPCKNPLCHHKTRHKTGYCQTCITNKPELLSSSKQAKQQNQSNHLYKRKSSTQRGYGYAWRKARIQHLKDNPLCIICKEQNRLTPANTVDHIKPHKGNMDLFWDQSNWQPLCSPCHNSTKQRIERANEKKIKHHQAW